MLPIKQAHEFAKLKEQAQENINQHNLGAFVESITQPFVHEIVESNFKKYFKTKDLSMIATFNDFGQRCDDFKKDHDGLHVLYAGCSFTYAEGVPIERSWSGLVHDYINKNIATTSGYFNVGKGGANFRVMENQILGYMRYSGKPDIIFVNLPELGRENVEHMITLKVISDEEEGTSRLSQEYLVTIPRLQERLENFSTFCEMLGIKLIIGCWTMNTDNFEYLSKKYGNPFDSKLLDVVDVSANTMTLSAKHDMGYKKFEIDLVKELTLTDDPLSNIIYVALDDSHPGLLGHRIMAEHFINKLNSVI